MSIYMISKTTLLILMAAFAFTASLQAQDRLVLPILEPIDYEINPDYSKPGGIVIGPAMPRAFHYGGRQAVRDLNGFLHVTWEDPSYFSHYYSRSLDILGLQWTEPINPMDSVGFMVDRALMAKMAIDPISGYLYMMPFYRVNPGETYKTGITRSTDNGETWSTYMDLGTKLGIVDEELAWGTFVIGDDQVLRIAVTLENSLILYTQADLSGNSNLDNLVFTQANGITSGVDSITVSSGVIFQGTIVLDRNNDPHFIFSGDGNPDTFGDKTPYHVYYKSAAGVWGPDPPQQLMTELEQTWGIPELVFDANNRGYYFLDLNPGDFIFGTWIPSGNDTSTTDFGTWNNTTITLTYDNFPNLDIADDDNLYLPNADVDDANDFVYVAGNTNSYSSGNGGDIVLLALEDASQYHDTTRLKDYDWTIDRWLTSDGKGLGDIGVDMIYNPASSKTDIFWSGAGATTNVATYGGEGPRYPCFDIQAYRISFVNTASDKIFVNENDEITIMGAVRNRGTCSLPPTQVIVTIQNADEDTVFTANSTIPPLGPGIHTPELNLGAWIVQGSRQRFVLILTAILPDDEGQYNNQIGTSFFVYPNPGNAFGWDNFQDSNYTNFPTFLADGSQFINYGTWYPANANTGGWTVIDSTHNVNDDYISSWWLEKDVMDNVNGRIRHRQGIRNDTLYGDISAPPQPQNELLFSPFYSLTNMEIVTLEWDDRIAGTDGANNYPIHAFVDITIDGGQTWLPIYHRSDTTGIEGTISGYGYQIFDITNQVTGADSVQVRFWWRNPSNDGSYATWEIDNVYIMNQATSAIINDPSSLPEDFTLHQNYPNPFNPVTTISYYVPVTSPIILRVYDILGREATTLIDGVVAAGVHRVRFDAGLLASGIYLYRLETKNGVYAKKMLVLK